MQFSQNEFFDDICGFTLALKSEPAPASERQNHLIIISNPIKPIFILLLLYSVIPLA